MKEVNCPSCGKASRWDGNAYRPFCCERCKLIDFGNWANEGYVVKSPINFDQGREVDDAEIKQGSNSDT